MLTMRSPKKILKGTIVLLLVSLLYNEFLVYYITLYSCQYPRLNEPGDGQVLDTMILADTHLLGSRNGHWFDKLRREWQMYRAFQTAVTYFRPDAVFFLGDIFDEGKWCPEEEFSRYTQRFESLFSVVPGTEVLVVAGNHDIGFHYAITPYLNARFKEVYNTETVRLVTLKGVHFILINSMAFEGDTCSLCKDAKKRLSKVSSNLTCTKGDKCSRPVLMSHFPLYRESDAMCDELDEAPGDDKFEKFREKWDCISNTSSELIKDKLRPRSAFTGHTHHGCRTEHGTFTEWTVSSFSWRNKKNPAFLLARFSSTSMSVSKCYMPDESTVFLVYTVTAALALLYCVQIKDWVFRRDTR